MLLPQFGPLKLSRRSRVILKCTSWPCFRLGLWPGVDALPVWTSVSHLGNVGAASHLSEGLWRSREHVNKALSLVCGYSLFIRKLGWEAEDRPASWDAFGSLGMGQGLGYREACGSVPGMELPRCLPGQRLCKPGAPCNLCLHDFPCRCGKRPSVCARSWQNSMRWKSLTMSCWARTW